MPDENVATGPGDDSKEVEGGVNDAGKGCQTNLGSTQAEAARIRAARAKLIEETTYRLTDLFTIISGRIEILSEKVPEICRQELLAIRSVLMRGVELNDRLYMLAQACRREIGRPLNSAEIMDE